jgi:hypothetical protein
MVCSTPSSFVATPYSTDALSYQLIKINSGSELDIFPPESQYVNFTTWCAIHGKYSLMAILYGKNNVGRTQLHVGPSGHVSGLDLLNIVSEEDLLQRFRFLSRTVCEFYQV